MHRENVTICLTVHYIDYYSNESSDISNMNRLKTDKLSEMLSLSASAVPCWHLEGQLHNRIIAPYIIIACKSF